MHVPLYKVIDPLEPAVRKLAAFRTGIVAVEGYTRGREMTTVEYNLEVFTGLLGTVLPTGSL